MQAIEAVHGRGKFFRVRASESRTGLAHIKDLWGKTSLLVEERGIPRRRVARGKLGIVPNDPQARLVSVADKNLRRRNKRAEMRDGFIRTVNDHRSSRREPCGGQFFRHFDRGAQRIRQAGNKFIHFDQSTARQFDQIAAAEKQSADDALQCRVRRVAAHHVKDCPGCDGLGFCHAMIDPAIEHFTASQLGSQPGQQIIRRGWTEERAERFRGFGDGGGAFSGVHRNHSSAAREHPRGKAAGSRPSNSKASPRLTAKSRVRMPTTDPTLAAS